MPSASGCSRRTAICSISSSGEETNRREDEYGGPTLAERARYSAEIVADIRKATGDRFVISYRFSQFKEVDYGATVASGPDDLRGMRDAAAWKGR